LTSDTLPLSDTLNLKVGAEIINGASNTSNNVMNLRALHIQRQGNITQEAQWNFYNSVGQRTLKYSAGTLHKIVIGTSPAGTISAFDSTVTTNNANLICVLTVQNNAAPDLLSFDLPFFNGLTVAQSAATNITVIYE
jgi:hypothetical protein